MSGGFTSKHFYTPRDSGQISAPRVAIVESNYIASCLWQPRQTSVPALTLILKESYNCKTRMPGTVKSRPTVAYWVQIDGINIATELIKKYYSNETLIQCFFNVRPTSATLAQH